ncbi:hypothetical protein GCM10011360_44630 [Primorskyibacter flagellatus]|uniref:Uncharacterized protein n=1 Tax=Primorskyibacter flagellatus TaxID=1387277 RepID=A0A917EKD0_9RHOB|nr:hypothetical protein GCM10011360_44630 [Primorskyibacter flagellatus]
MDVEAKGVSGLGDDGRDRALERVEPGILGGHRVQTVEAEGGHEVALTQHHDIVIGASEIRQVLREIAFSREVTSARLMQGSPE